MVKYMQEVMRSHDASGSQGEVWDAHLSHEDHLTSNLTLALLALLDFPLFTLPNPDILRMRRKRS